MLTPGKNKRDNKLSILNMKENNQYVLTVVKSDLENNRVELFLNNEYKGVYYIDERNKEPNNMPNSNDFYDKIS